MLEGTEAQFYCEVLPEQAEVILYVNGKELSVSTKYQVLKYGKSRRLTMKNCQEVDAGSVEARLGNKHTRATLSVRGLYDS